MQIVILSTTAYSVIHLLSTSRYCHWRPLCLERSEIEGHAQHASTRLEVVYITDCGVHCCDELLEESWARSCCQRMKGVQQVLCQLHAFQTALQLPIPFRYQPELRQQSHIQLHLHLRHVQTPTPAETETKVSK